MLLSLKTGNAVFPSFLQGPCLLHHLQGNTVPLPGRKGKSPHQLFSLEPVLELMELRLW